MRLLLETLACRLDISKFPNRKTGQVEEVPTLVISGVDVDFMDSLLKVKVYKPKDLNRTFKKGELLSVRFRQSKFNDFEKSTVINANEDDVVLHQNGGVNQVHAEPAPAMAA